MIRYIALLRGINVGGKNTVPMKELKAAFEEDGFLDVITYINSGNIIFSSAISEAQLVKTRCEALIQKRFGLTITVMVISGRDLREALASAPDWWDNDKESKHNALFVIPPATVEEVFGEVGDTKPEYERVDYFGKVIFWSAPIKTFSRTRWSKIVGSTAYGSITIRNANTAKKLAELCSDK